MCSWAVGLPGVSRPDDGRVYPFHVCCEVRIGPGSRGWMAGSCAYGVSTRSLCSRLSHWTRDHHCLVDWTAANLRDPQEPWLIRQLHVERWLIGSTVSGKLTLARAYRTPRY